MAAKDPNAEEEKRELEEMLKMTSERKKAVFERTKEADEELLKIREEEMAVQKRLQEIRAEEIERDQRKRYEARLDVELKELKQKYEALKSQNAEQCTSLRKTKDIMQRITQYSKTQLKEKEQALRRVVTLEDMIAALRSEEIGKEQREEHEANVDVESKKLSQKYEPLELRKGQGPSVGSSVLGELEHLRSQNAKQNTSVRKVKDAMQRITIYSKTQQKEKEQALRREARLKDENAALKQISAETQQRQLNELQLTSVSIEQQQQQQQHRKGKAGC